MMSALRRYLIAGLLVWLPLAATFLVVGLLVDVMDRSLLLIPVAYRPDNLLGVHIPGLGVLLTILLLLVTGIVVANLFGRKLFALWEAVLARIPLVRSIYTGVKQVTESVLSSKGQSFRKVLLVEYPRRDMWTLAFQTGSGVGEVQHKLNQPMVNVFVPLTPIPTSGFYLMLPREDVIELDMSVEEGLKMILSMGVVVPGVAPGTVAPAAPRP